MLKFHRTDRGLIDWRHEGNAPTVALIRRLWDEGLTTHQIAAKIGVSKSVIIGLAHRLHFPSRPSPIKAERVTWEAVDRWVADTAPELSDLAPGPRLAAANVRRKQAGEPVWVIVAKPPAAKKPQGPSVAVRKEAARTAIRLPSYRMPVARAVVLTNDVQEDEHVEEVRDRAVTIRTVLREARYTRGPISTAKECQWPIGDPKRAGFRFCCDAVVAGRSYCLHHHRIAYLSVDRRAA